LRAGARALSLAAGAAMAVRAESACILPSFL
jgi:hypothetical protein